MLPSDCRGNLFLPKESAHRRSRVLSLAHNSKTGSADPQRLVDPWRRHPCTLHYVHRLGPCARRHERIPKETAHCLQHFRMFHMASRRPLKIVVAQPRTTLTRWLSTLSPADSAAECASLFAYRGDCFRLRTFFDVVSDVFAKHVLRLRSTLRPQTRFAVSPGIALSKTS